MVNCSICGEKNGGFYPFKGLILCECHFNETYRKIRKLLSEQMKARYDQKIGVQSPRTLVAPDGRMRLVRGTRIKISIKELDEIKSQGPLAVQQFAL